MSSGLRKAFLQLTTDFAMQTCTFAVYSGKYKTCTIYLLHRIIDSYPQILKLKIIRLKPVLLVPTGQWPGLTDWF